jgi:hypothetical protein
LNRPSPKSARYQYADTGNEGLFKIAQLSTFFSLLASGLIIAVALTRAGELSFVRLRPLTLGGGNLCRALDLQIRPHLGGAGSADYGLSQGPC